MWTLEIILSFCNPNQHFQAWKSSRVSKFCWVESEARSCEQTDLLGAGPSRRPGTCPGWWAAAGRLESSSHSSRSSCFLWDLEASRTRPGAPAAGAPRWLSGPSPDWPETRLWAGDHRREDGMVTAVHTSVSYRAVLGWILKPQLWPNPNSV